MTKQEDFKTAMISHCGDACELRPLWGDDPDGVYYDMWDVVEKENGNILATLSNQDRYSLDLKMSGYHWADEYLKVIMAVQKVFPNKSIKVRY